MIRNLISRIRVHNISRLSSHCDNLHVKAYGSSDSLRFMSNSTCDTESSYTQNNDDELVTVTYVEKDGTRKTVQGKVGQDVMRLAQKHGIPIEGACEASIACSTCHVYVSDKYFAKLPGCCEEEDDMLDQAPFLKPNSRLGCQIKLTKELDGIEVHLPPATRNFYVDGKVPAPH